MFLVYSGTVFDVFECLWYLMPTVVSLHSSDMMYGSVLQQGVFGMVQVPAKISQATLSRKMESACKTM